MPQPSDSNYASVTRHCRPFLVSSRPVVLLNEHPVWNPSVGRSGRNAMAAAGASSSRDDSEWNDFHLFSSTWMLSDRLEDDDIPVARHEAVVAPLLEEGEFDADAIVVSPAGNSSIAANNAKERSRREERWGDLGLDHFTVPLHASTMRYHAPGSRTATHTTTASSSGATRQRPATANPPSS